MSKTKRSLEASDIHHMKIPSDPRVSPTDDRCVFTYKYVDKETKKVASNLWMVRPGEEARPFTRGLYRDYSAKWSPDGKWIAFLTNRPDAEKKAAKHAGKKAQLAVMPADGGDARILTDVDAVIGGFEWSPDGSRFVLCMRKNDAIPDGEDGPVSLRITRLRYKIDGGGYYPQDRLHIYDLEIEEGATPRQLTSGDWDDTGPTWSPDGKSIAFMSNRRDDREKDDEGRDLYIMPAGGGEPKQLTTVRGGAWCPVFSPDGKRIVYLRCAGAYGNSFFDNTHLFACDLGTGKEWNLLPELDRSVINVTIGELYGLEHLISPPVFTPDGKSVTFVIADSGRSHVARVAIREPDGPAPKPQKLYDAESVVHFQQTRPGGKMAILITSPTIPAHLVMASADGSEAKLLLDPNPWLAEVALVEAEDIWSTPEPGVKIHGWLMKPSTPGPHPLILYIHGGPHLAYGVPFAFEFQYLVAAGYAVVFGNPRGSHGYGLEFASCVVADWAERPMRDLESLVDESIKKAKIDTDRLAIAGGSYGGYMTLWMLSHTRRYKVGCSQRPVCDLFSMTYSDFGGYMDWLFGAIPWEKPELCQKLSPIHHVQNIEAPLLLIQGMSDQRTPSDQAERAYVTMKHMGKNVEMVLFPGADHHLSRTGRPSQQIARLEAIREWFDRHLTAR